MLRPRKGRGLAELVDRIAVSVAVKRDTFTDRRGHVSRLARSLGLSEVDMVTEARRQYAIATPARTSGVRANTAILVAELDAWLRARAAS